MMNAWLLWFLPLAAVPVLLHLVTRRRLARVELATFRFLMESYVQQRRRWRFLEWLILLLRVAFVALIVFMMARPVTRGIGFLGAGSLILCRCLERLAMDEIVVSTRGIRYGLLLSALGV